METSQLNTFITLAEVGQMTKAAKRLHLTQPAVSSQLARLEESVGTRLFDRTAQGLLLTQAGATLLDYARQALAAMDEGQVALDALTGLVRGSISFGGGATATTYLLPKILAEFHDRYPEIRFFVREQPSRRVVDAVLAGALDLGVVTLPVERRNLKKIKIETWVADELRLIVPSDHKLHGRKTFRWKELHQQPLVLFEAGSAVRTLIDDRIAESGIQTDLVMELRSIESIKQMVRQGIGCGFVSQHALTSRDHGIRCSDGAIGRELAVIYRTDRAMTTATQKFLDLLFEKR